MSRVRTLFVTILPSAIAGGFLFASAFGHAETGRDGSLGFWPAASDATGSVLVAQADPRPTPRPMPPVPPAPPVTGVPVPPVPPPPPGYGQHSRRSRHHGMSLSIHDGKVEFDGIAELVQESLERALETLDNLPDVPPDVRDRVKDRIKNVRNNIKSRLNRLKGMDLDKLGPELERMGDDIEREMSGLDRDLAQLGEKVGKSFAQKFGKDFGKDLAKSFGPNATKSNDDSDDDDDSDSDSDDDDSSAPIVINPGTDRNDAAEATDVAPRIAALKSVSLDAGQRAQLARLRADADRQIATAKRELEAMSNHLHDSLRDASVSPADIDAQIDSISAKEAAIRKARIGAWLRARSLLRKDQRQQVEQAIQNR